MKNRVLEIRTKSRFEMRDITSVISESIRDSGVMDGICVIYTPHTTSALMINEHADPDVMKDVIRSLDLLVPENGSYNHAEGNSQAHIKSSIIGNSRIVIIENGEPLLGTWEGVFFCEFDGPRNRRVVIKALSG